MKKILVIGLVLGVLGAGVVWLLRDDLIGALRKYRGEQLLTEAEAAVDREEWELASRKGVAAHFQLPDRVDIMSLVAEARLEMRMEDSIGWFERVLNEGGEIAAPRLSQIIRILLASDQIERTQPFLMELVQLDSQSEETRELWLAVLGRQNNYQMAERLRNAWNLNQQLDRESLNNLVEAMEKGSGNLATIAAQELAVAEDVPDEIRRRALDNLDPEGNFREKLLYLGGQRLLGDMSDEAIRESMQEIYAEATGDDLRLMLNWSNWMGPEWSEYFDSLVVEEEWGERGAQIGYWWRSLAARERWEALADSVQGELEDSAGDAGVRTYFRGLYQLHLGRTEQGYSDIALSVQTAEPESLEFLAQSFLQDNDLDNLLLVYRREYEESDGSDLATRQLAGILYLMGKQEDLQLLLLDYEIPERTNEVFRGFVHYLRLLFGINIQDTVQELERLHAESPEFYDYRLLLGFGYFLRGQQEEGRQFLNRVPQLESDSPRHFRIIYAVLSGDPFLPSLNPKEKLLMREQFLLKLVRDKAG